MPRTLRSRTALLPILALALACKGDGQPSSASDTVSAGGTVSTATAEAAIVGGDTAVAPDPPTGRPVPGPGSAVTGAASGTASATASAGSTSTGAAETATPPVRPDSQGAIATPGQPTTPATSPSASLATSQETALAPAPAAVARGRAVVPFAVNERLEFDVRFGAIDVGDAAMQLNGIETVRGRETYHTVFRVSGGTLFFKVNDRYESWIDTRTLVSHRFVQQIDEGSYERERVFEIYPERLAYRENQKPEQKTVAEPLDDGSFFYFVRTIPLEVGKTYTFDRYFKPASNPVTIKVLRKERVKVPAGTFDAIVIQPLIKTKGIFGEGGRAEIWLADDSTRAMLQMKSQLKFGSLNLYLKKYRPGARPVAQ
jgi:hypothetical protein